MAKANPAYPDPARAVLAGSFAANGESAAVEIHGPFHVTVGNPGGGSVAVQCSFDGGATWHPVARDTSGTPIALTGAASLVVPSVEPSMLYRLAMTGYAAPTPYRISQ